MKYTVWDGISYGEGDPIVPFSKIFESDDLNSVIKFVDNNNNNKSFMFITDEENIIFDNINNKNKI